MGNVLNRKILQAGKVVFGGLIVSGLVGGGVYLNSLSTDGTIQKQDSFAAFVAHVFDISGTGSTSAQNGTAYDAACIPNPHGTGAIMHGRYHNIANPTAASVYIGFVDSCDDLTSSGADLLALGSSCNSTGCTAAFNTEDVTWPGDQYIKVVITEDPTADFDGKVTLWYEDILGE
jgi:hypothetical protein